MGPHGRLFGQYKTCLSYVDQCHCSFCQVTVHIPWPHLENGKDCRAIRIVGRSTSFQPCHVRTD